MRVKGKKLSGAKKEKFSYEIPRDLLARGNECLSRGSEAEAIAFYNKAIEYLEYHKEEISHYKAYFSEMYNALGKALLNVNKKNDAYRIFNKALQIDSNNTDIWINRGNTLVLLAKKMHDEALSSFDSALTINPKDMRALSSKGEALEKNNELDAAMECYHKIIDIYPDELEFYDKILKLIPNEKTIWFKKGEVLDRQEKHEEALVCFDKALEIDPKEKEFLRSKAGVLGKLGRYEESVDTFKKGIEIDDKDKMLWKGMGSILQENGKLKEAKEAYESAIKLDEHDKDLWNNKGLILFEMGSLKEALDAYEKALEIEPDNILILTSKKEVLMALERPEDVIKVCDKILDINPKNIQTLNDKGSVLLHQGEFEKAIELFNKVLEVDSRDIKALKYKKQAYIQLKQLGGVLESLDKIVKFYPEDLDAWVERGEVLLEMGQVDQAISSYNNALSIKPENLNAMIKKKNVLKLLGREEEIITTCDSILDFEPNNLKALEDKGESFIKLAKNEEAIEVLDKLLTLDSKNVTAFIKKGVAFIRMGEYEKAINCYDEALKLNPDSKEALENKGDALSNLGNLDGAEICYENALKLDEKDAKLWDKWGNILLGKEKYEDVLVSYEKALAQDPNNSKYLYLKGFSLEKLNRDEEALKSFESALDVNEKFEDALMGKSLVLMKMGRESEVLEATNKLLEINEENLKALEIKRRVHMKLENYEELNSTCNRILELDVNNLRAWEDKAYALVKLGKQDTAVSVYDKALSIEPDNLKLLIQKKDALKALERYEDVIHACDTILEKEPKNIEVLKEKGEALENLKRYEEAKEIYNQLLDSFPKDMVTLHRKAKVLFKLGLYEESLRCYDETLNLNEKDKMLWNDTGILLLEMKDYEKAIECFDSALKLDSEDDDIWTNKALALHRQGMHDKGLETLGKAIELNKKKNGVNEGIKEGINSEIEIFNDIMKALDDGDKKNRYQEVLSYASEAHGNDNYEDSHRHLMECKNILEEYRKTSIENTDFAITELREMKGETSEFEKMLNEAKSLSGDKKYSEYLSILNKIKKETNEQQYRIATELLTEISENIQYAKDSNIDISMQDNTLAEAKEAIDQKSFRKAYTLMIQSKDEIQRLIEKHKELSSALNLVKSQIEEAQKEGIEMSTPQKKIESAITALEAHDFETVSKTIEESKKDIDQLVKTHHIKEKITQSNDYINIVKDLKIDTSEVELLIKNAVSYLNDGQFENALDSAIKSEEKAQKLCDIKISEMLSSIYSKMIEAKKIGLEVMTVEVPYRKAKNSLALHRYEKAARYTSQSLQEIEEINDESLRAANIIYLARNYILEAENIKADISEAKKLLEKALSQLKGNEYITSMEFGKKSIKLAKKAKELKVSEAIDLFQSLINNSKSKGKDVFEADKKLKEAKTALADDDLRKALILAMQSESEVGQEELQRKMVAEILTGTAEKLKEAEKNGIESERIRTLLTYANTALENNQYVRALGYVMESGMELIEAKEDYERASTTLYAAFARMNEGNDIGVDIKSTKELYEAAKKAFEESNFSGTIKFAKETIKKADQSYVEHLYKPIENCEQLIKTAELLGVNIRRASNMLTEAKAALDEGFYLEVRSFTESCRKFVEKEIRTNLFEKIYSAKATLDKAKGEGMDISDAMMLLESAESHLESDEYIEAVNYFQKFMDSLGTVKTDNKQREEEPQKEEAKDNKE